MKKECRDCGYVFNDSGSHYCPKCNSQNLKGYDENRNAEKSESEKMQGYVCELYFEVNTIKKCVLFFTILTIIGLVANTINSIYICSQFKDFLIK